MEVNQTGPPPPPPPPAAPVLPLFSQTTVTLASFFGGGFALGYFLSRNLRRTGHTGAANNYLLGGIFAAILCALLLASRTKADFGELRDIYILIQALWAIVAYYLFPGASGKQVEEQVAIRQNRYGSIASEIGLSLAFFSINLFVIFFLGIYISY